MLVECKGCGAPLDVETGSAFAKCSYCGRTNKVKSAATLIAERSAHQAPPPVWPAPERRPAPAPARGTHRLAPLAPWIGVCFALLVGVVSVWSQSAVSALFPWAGVDADGSPTLGIVDLTRPAGSLRGVAEGSHRAAELGETCRGYIAREPHAILRTAEPMAVRVAARDASVDLVMAVRTADGRRLCDDDSGGSLMPLVRAVLPPGDHRVWVGVLSSTESAPFRLEVEAQPAGGARTADELAPDATPRIGEVRLGAEAAQGTWPSTTSGWVEARRAASGCRGAVPVAPHLRITTAQPRTVELTTRTNGGIDLVMLVRSPSGRIECDDDSGELLNPRILTQLEPGATNVWVGVFRDDASASFELVLSEPIKPPDALGMAAPPTLGVVDLDVPGHATSFASTVRPERPLHELGARCGGFGPAVHDLVVLTTAPRELALTARGADGLRLVVRAPDGTVSCAEGDAAGASLRQALAPGAHHVWVGSAHRRSTPYELSLSP